LIALSRLAPAQQLAGSTRPSMLISSGRLSVLEPILPWK
jgi:hypothetical protein